jgi:hypothetical protein
MVFRPKCEAVAADCMKLYKENHDTYSSLIIFRVHISRWMNCAERVNMHGGEEKCLLVFGGRI